MCYKARYGSSLILLNIMKGYKPSYTDEKDYNLIKWWGRNLYFMVEDLNTDYIARKGDEDVAFNIHGKAMWEQKKKDTMKADMERERWEDD